MLCLNVKCYLLSHSKVSHPPIKWWKWLDLPHNGWSQRNNGNGMRSFFWSSRASLPIALAGSYYPGGLPQRSTGNPNCPSWPLHWSGGGGGWLLVEFQVELLTMNLLSALLSGAKWMQNLPPLLCHPFGFTLAASPVRGMDRLIQGTSPWDLGGRRGAALPPGLDSQRL